MKTLKLGDAEIEELVRIAESERWGSRTFMYAIDEAGYEIENGITVRSALKGFRNMTVGHAYTLTKNQWYKAIGIARCFNGDLKISNRLLASAFRRRKVPTSRHVLQQACIAAGFGRIPDTILPAVLDRMAEELGVTETETTNA